MQTMIYVGSISHAMRAKRILEQQGIRAYIRQRTQEQEGCGYSLLIPSYSPSITALLRANGIPLPAEKGRDGV